MSILQLQKQSAIRAASINFRKNNQRRLEIDGQPENFNEFVQDISYSQGKIESTSFRIGNGEVSLPNFKPVGSITAVFRDDDIGTISQFIKSLQRRIFNEDGTQNLPVDFLFSLRIYRISDDGTEYLETESMVYLEENHEYSGSDEDTNTQGTFSVTFKKFKSFGA